MYSGQLQIIVEYGQIIDVKLDSSKKIGMAIWAIYLYSHLDLPVYASMVDLTQAKSICLEQSQYVQFYFKFKFKYFLDMYLGTNNIFKFFEFDKFHKHFSWDANNKNMLLSAVEKNFNLNELRIILDPKQTIAKILDLSMD